MEQNDEIASDAFGILAMTKYVSLRVILCLFPVIQLGQILAVETIWKKLKLDETLNRVQAQYEIKIPLSKAVKLMVLNRLSDPKSCFKK